MSLLLYEGVAVYELRGLWRVVYCGTILTLDDDRKRAAEYGKVYAKHFRVQSRVFSTATKGGA